MDTIRSLWHDRPTTTLLATFAALGLLPALGYARSSYNGFIALGPGGMPYNVFGWLMQASMQLIARHDVASTAILSRPSLDAIYGPLGRTSFLAQPLPSRKGPRPTVPGYVAPQRQTTAVAPHATVTRMRTYLQDLHVANADFLAMRPSGLEGGYSQAVFVRAPADGGKVKEMPRVLARIGGEAVHVHEDGSSHVTLSLKDAEEVIEKGWAIKHKLSAVGGVVPPSYVLLYAPRDEDEFEVWKGFVKAGFQFLLGGRELSEA